MVRVANWPAVASAFIASALALTATPALAIADSGSSMEASEIASDAISVAPDIGTTIAPETIGGKLVAAGDDTSSSIPVSAAGDIILTTTELSASGIEVTVGLPTAEGTEDARVVNGGQVVYLTEEPDDADVVVEQTARTLRIQTVIGGKNAPSEYAYPIGGDVSPVLTGDGSVDLVVTDGDFETVVGGFDAPWAIDANGDPVATRYVIRGTDIVQVVDHTAADVEYPVVADPTFSRINIWQTRIRWNRAETATLASAGWGPPSVTAVCGLAGAAVGGPPGAAVGAGICLVASGTIVWQAGVAQNSKPKRCVQLTYTWTPGWAPGGWWVDQYACR